ncbi:hypothetical protein [Corynebacterium aquilae]|uniref:Asparagine synthetase domain-containing protein n=1 Tax=Corynebacterium aquilae DSM 44791 TaxID=1431546 RepID=A0A1L7CIQ7_9CORY|nr:hypothetical protein [Corynebacterium aquilae]APT85663.1 hypothetical protein CAQU_12145 [Corynebacterium aquilae DSM 44791]
MHDAEPEMDRAFRREPVFLVARLSSAEHAEVIRKRLASFFEVQLGSVQHWRGQSLSSFYIEPAQPPAGATWISTTSEKVAVSAHTIFSSTTLNKRDVNGLLRFAPAVSDSNTTIQELSGPLSYILHKIPQDIAYAVNDVFGFGSLYISTAPDFVAFGTSIEAIAVAQDIPTQISDDYWSAYYVAGCGIGNITSMKGVEKVPPGSRVSLGEKTFVVSDVRSYDRLLEEKVDEPADIEGVIEAAVGVLGDCKAHLDGKTDIGLSGGMDSRFVVACALAAGLDFETFTRVPPQLEATIAQDLMATIGKEDSHSVIPLGARDAESPFYRGVPSMPDTPILARAEEWFRYTGGDCWSTSLRFESPHLQPKPTDNFFITGIGGGLDRQVAIIASDMEAGTPEFALRRYVSTRMEKRAYLPRAVRERGTSLYEKVLLDAFFKGFDGYQALGIAWLNSRFRRGFPVPDADTMALKVLPKLFVETFKGSAQDKYQAAVLKEATARLVPEWRNVPYYAEAAKNHAREETNKVTIQPTYWEVNREEFLEAATCAMQKDTFLNLSNKELEATIDTVPDGRAATNYSFEFLFWQYSCIRTVERLNAIKKSHPLK